MPVSYAFIGGRIIFHCGLKGSKLDFIRDNPRVCFVVSRHPDRVKPHHPEKGCDYRYESVICSGKARIVEEVAERRELLNKFLAHAECPSDFISAVDFMGGTGDMMRYVESTNAAAYLLVTECGFGELAKLRFPGKNFIAMCRLCPYMKSITLDSVLALLKDPEPEEVTVPGAIAGRAKRSIDRMFELAA